MKGTTIIWTTGGKTSYFKGYPAENLDNKALSNPFEMK